MSQFDLQIIPDSAVRGEISVPGDKSISHRALMLSAIAEGESILCNPLMGADNQASLIALQQLGVSIKVEQHQLSVQGVGRQGLCSPHDQLDLGNAGTAMRLLTGLLAGQNFSSRLTGDASLTKRPMNRIVAPLTQMGAKIAMSAQGTAPLDIQGGQSLLGICYQLPVASAQVKSGLLFAGLYAQGTTTIIEPIPTRDHTERLLAAFSYPLMKKPQQITIEGQRDLHSATIHIPGDLSSAAFFIVAALITPGSELIIKNVGINPTRLGVIHILRKMGGEIEIGNMKTGEYSQEPSADIWVRYSRLKGIEIPVEQVSLSMDEFPIIFIAAACAKGNTILRSAEELRVKESDRLAAMSAGLTKLSIEHRLFADGIGIKGGKFSGGIINSYDDHRVAMAFAIAGQIAKAPIIVNRCESIATSFPNFIELAKQVGMNINKN